MKGLLMALAIAIPATGRAQARATTDTVKIGKYELEITMESGTLTGELNVKRSAEGYTAAIRAGGMIPDVKSFRRDGAKYVLTAGNSDHSIVYTFTFAKDSVHGSFALGGGMTGTVAGLFRP